jgi:hypothetical protein
MKVMLVLDGLHAVIDDAPAAPCEPVDDGAQVLDDGGNDAGDRVEAAFFFRGTRAELLGTARAIDALMGREQRRRHAADAELAYDFEAPAVISTEWVSLGGKHRFPSATPWAPRARRERVAG